VPRLFATPHGLHVRSTSAPNGQPHAAAAAERRQLAAADESSGSRKCDVFGSVSALRNDDPLNTSDYDSGEEGCDGAGRGGSCPQERCSESRDPPPKDAADPAALRTAWLPPSPPEATHHEQAVSRSTWYDDDDDDDRSETETRVDNRLVDSGVGTFKQRDVGVEGPSHTATRDRLKQHDIGVEGAPPETAEVLPLGDVPVKTPESAAPPAGATEPPPPVQTEGGAKQQQKKRVKNDDGRSSRRVADAEMSDSTARKEVGNVSDTAVP